MTYRIVKYVSTLRNPVIEMQIGQNNHSRSDEDMSFINTNEDDQIVEADSDEGMLQQMYVYYICHIMMCIFVYLHLT